jgi:hypothetical protein
MSLTELALLGGRRPLHLGDVTGLTLNFKLYGHIIIGISMGNTLEKINFFFLTFLYGHIL